MTESSTTRAETRLVYHIRHVPAALIVALVVLRVATGWHFWSEGTKKLEYNRGTGETRIAFSAEGFLRGAVGPWADWFKRDLPSFHDWERHLVAPRKAATTEEDLKKRATWAAEYARRRREAQQKGEPAPVEFPPMAPYTTWAEQIDADWRATVDRFKAIEGMSAEQEKAAEVALHARRQELADYLGTVENSFADWQHELYRLGAWEAEDEAGGVPFQEERIGEKRTQTTGGATGWVNEVRAIEDGLHSDLRGVLNDEQRTSPATVEAVDVAVGDAKSARLEKMNIAVTCLIIGVGACLLLGLFTRLAALGGIVFLTMVIASQPPWVAGANTTMFYYQLVEIAALVALLAAGAGRWAGLDFFLRALFGRRRAAVVERH